MGLGRSKVTADTMNGSDMVLYLISGSPACFRAMIALEEKRLTNCAKKQLNYLENEHKSEPVIAINPRGQVPTFTHNGQPINESMAICEYVQSLFPDQGTSLTVSDKDEYRVMLQRKYEAQNLQKKCEDIVYYVRGKAENEIDKVELAKRKKEFLQELKLWESHLKQIGGGDDTYLASSQSFTLADLAFYPYLAFCVHFGLKLDTQSLPCLTAYYNRTSSRDSVKRAWPDYWKLPVTPEQMMFVDL